MSVINDMLRGLDQRQAPERAPGYINASSSDVRNSMIEPQKKNKLSLLIVLLIVVLVLVWSIKSLLDSSTSLVSVTPLVTNDAKLNVSEKRIKPQVAPILLDNKNENITKATDLSKSTTFPKPKLTKARASSKFTHNKTLVAEPKTVKALPSVTLPEQKLSAPLPKNIEAQKEAIQNVKVQAMLSPEAKDKAMAKHAAQMFQIGESRQSYRTLFDFIESHEVDVKSRIVLASHLLSDKRLAEAGDVLLSTQSERDPTFRQLKARWQVAKGEHKLAILTLQDNLPEIALYPGYYALLASYYQQFGYPQLALKTYSDLVQFNENVADWWAGLAIAADQSKQWLQAEFAYKHAVQLPDLNPQLISFVKNRIETLDQMSRH